MQRLWTLDPNEVQLTTSRQAVDEARRNLPTAQHPELDTLVLHLDVVVTPRQRDWRPLPGVILPLSDLAILQAAIDTGATHLLTGDRRHFGPYYGQTIEGVLILPPAEFRPLTTLPNRG
jgi:hypothetical protein